MPHSPQTAGPNPLIQYLNRSCITLELFMRNLLVPAVCIRYNNINTHDTVGFRHISLALFFPMPLRPAMVFNRLLLNSLTRREAADKKPARWNKTKRSNKRMGKQSESNSVSVSFVRANHFIKVSPIRRGSFGFTALGHIVFCFGLAPFIL